MSPPHGVCGCATRADEVLPRSGRVRVHNYINGALIKELDPHHGPVTHLGFAKEDRVVLSGAADSSVQVRPISRQGGGPAKLALHRGD